MKDELREAAREADFRYGKINHEYDDGFDAGYEAGKRAERERIWKGSKPMTKITIETETITTDLTPSEAAAKIKEALGIAEWPQIYDWYWYVDSFGIERKSQWQDSSADRYRQSLGNCSPTQEGLAQYKADMAKYAAIVAIRKHRDKTFGVFEPGDGVRRRYVISPGGHLDLSCALAGLAVPFRTESDIEQSLTECGEHWEVLR